MNVVSKAGLVAALDEIRGVVGRKGWTDAPADMAPFLAEERGLFRGDTAMVVRPASAEQVADVVAICARHKVPIVPQGGNTSLVGASVPYETGSDEGPGGEAGILLSLSRLNRVREIDTFNDTITVEAGCILATVQKAAEEADRLFPLSLGAEGTCQIGGNLSTNAGGVAVLRYGNMRELVLGLEVVLPDGRIWNGLRGLRKDNTGYDLKQLFIGAEGTLGVITAAVLKLFPRPREMQTAIAAIDAPATALEMLARLRAATGNAVTGFEIMSRIGLQMALDHMPGTTDPFKAIYPLYLLIELSGAKSDGGMRAALEETLGAAISEGLVRDAVIAESLEQARQLWALREGIAEAQKFEGGSIKHDVAVPVSRVADFIVEATRACEAALPGIRVVAFGHVGDGNIHFNLSQPIGADKAGFLAEWGRMNRVVHDIVVGMRGTISAEHGIGRIKRSELQRYAPEAELDLMHRIKEALDPDGIMNPGKIL